MKKYLSMIAAAAVLSLVPGCTDTGISTSGSAPSSITISTTDSGADDSGASAPDTSSSTISEASSPEPVPETPPEPARKTVTLLCAGDNLLHDNIVAQARRRANANGDPSGYDFLPSYEATAELVKAADLAILNQETVVTDLYPPSNYPMFCSPEAAGDQMVELGFDVMSIGNNHVLDKGESGLTASLEYWKNKHPDIPVYGACMKEDADKIPTLEVNGITFAFLGFMEHTNGLYLPRNSNCKITYLDEREEVERQVRAAREIADVVIVSAHYGVEVTNIVTDDQLSATRDLVDWGADIIIGTQPHTVQPMEFVNKPDGGQAFVFYCLGNYISSMTGTPTAMVGMLGQLTVAKEPDGSITLENPGAVPIITHINRAMNDVSIYLWEDYTEELASKHGTQGFSYALAKKLVEQYVVIKDLLDE